MEKTYNPQDIEQPLYEHWEQQGYFKPNGDTSQESFCIMIPPPNVTGSFHMGHAFQQTSMAPRIRYQRRQGDLYSCAQARGAGRDADTWTIQRHRLRPGTDGAGD